MQYVGHDDKEFYSGKTAERKEQYEKGHYTETEF